MDRYAPSNRWHIDTLITMLSIAGASLPDERISSSLILLIQRNPELHAYVVHKLFWALHDDVSQLSLVHVGIWCVGEYGKALLLEPPTSEDTLSDKARVDESAVVELFKKVLRHHHSTDTTKSYALNAMMKLTTRFQNPAEVQKLTQLIASFNSSVVLDLQQRATEYTTLGKPQWASLRPDILASMPAIDVTKLRNRQNRVDSVPGMSGSSNMMDMLSDDSYGSDAPKKQQAAPAAVTATPNLLDLDDIFGGGSSSGSASSAPAAPVETPAPAAAVDLLADLFSTGPTSAPPAAPFGLPVATAAAPASNSADDLLGLMDFGAPKPAPPQNPKIRAYEKNGLSVDLEISKPNKDDPSVTFIAATVRNATAIPLTNFLFLAAFPKYIKLKMEPASADVVPPNNAGVVTQLVKIQNAMHGEVRSASACISWVTSCSLVMSNVLLLSCACFVETCFDAHQARLHGEREQSGRHGGREFVPGQHLEPPFSHSHTVEESFDLVLAL